MAEGTRAGIHGFWRVTVLSPECSLTHRRRWLQLASADLELARQADAAQEGLEARVGAKGVHAGINVEIDQPVRVFFGGFFKIFHRAVMLAQAEVDSGEEVRR